jgi:hypothetical protein
VAPESEKRKITRSDFLQTIPIQLTKEQKGKLELLENISRGIDINSLGLGILTNLPLQKGDVVKVQLPSKAEGTVLPVLSQVVWTIKQNSEFRVGLQFFCSSFSVFSSGSENVDRD